MCSTVFACNSRVIAKALSSQRNLHMRQLMRQFTATTATATSTSHQSISPASLRSDSSYRRSNLPKSSLSTRCLNARSVLSATSSRFASTSADASAASSSASSQEALPKSEIESRVLSAVRAFMAQKFPKDDKDTAAIAEQEAKIIPSAHFSRDLGLDSLDTVELVMAIEDEFEVEISDAQSDAIATAQDAIDFLDSQKLTREVKMDAKAIKEDKREIKV